MISVIVDKNQKILRNKAELEKELGLKISIKKNEVSLDGKAEQEFIGEKVIEAINFGFPVQVALSLKKEDFMFYVLTIKDYTHRKDLASIRARVIGTDGRTLRTLATLTDCFFEMKDNEVGIIGAPEYIKNAQNAIISLIRGAKQANIYGYLEHHKVEPVFDLGLKEQKSKKSRKVKKVKE